VLIGLRGPPTAPVAKDGLGVATRQGRVQQGTEAGGDVAFRRRDSVWYDPNEQESQNLVLFSKGMGSAASDSADFLSERVVARPRLLTCKPPRRRAPAARHAPGRSSRRVRTADAQIRATVGQKRAIPRT
jgi:hypothetical protein